MVGLPADFASHFEQAMARTLEPLGFVPQDEPGARIDLATADGHTIVELKTTGRVLPRDLGAAASQLAVACRQTRAREAALAWWCPTFSARRVRATWDELKSVFARDIASRLRLVMASPTEQLVVPDDDAGGQLLRALREATTGVTVSSVAASSDRSYEVLKILMLRWLRHEPPISMGQLQAQSGLSHPTVAARVRELGSAIERTSNRAVALRELPVAVWNELLALSPKVRRTVGFEDRSGRAADLRGLVERLRRKRPPHVAIGGVIAARYWQPAFDLDGIPRVDVEVHAPTGGADLGFVGRLDPALAPVRDDRAPVLVVHHVTRAVALFEKDPAGGLPFADPVEVLLDLHQLRLHAHADELVRYLRKRR